MSETRWRLIVVAALAALGIVLAAVLLVLAPSGTPGKGPVPIAYDHEACAACRMSIGEPRFAAQIQTTDGRVLDFDDPGCLMTYEKHEHPKEAAVWFHDSKGTDWIRARDVGFVEGGPTPMGYNLVAVNRRRTPGAITLAEARARVSRRSARPMRMRKVPRKDSPMAVEVGR